MHYRAAQRFQFEQNDCANAVKSWEAYLIADPRGPLVLDARYHRAECLFQLGRSAEARAALKPFADGEYGSYRRDAARKLLELP
jgi:predicted Zn-dependent protease